MSRLLVVAALCTANISAYSVLTHEAIIDSVWEESIAPILRDRYPGLTSEDLRRAHAHAYGGAILQDLGYYPFGSKLFSDLVHYVRCGDFVLALLSEATNADELAFAYGALAHYTADNNGHSVAINRVVPLLYPKLRRKFGDTVTFDDAPGAHMKTEFAFDVIHVAQQRYAPDAYTDFIGFKVAKPALERAFLKTYGIELKDIFLSVDLALGTYRHTVSGLIPEMTKVAWAANKDEIVKARPGATQREFVYNLSRASYEKQWGKEYERPRIFARCLAFLFRILPKVGPLRAFGFHMPTPAAQDLFMKSFNQTLDAYRARLAAFERREPLQLINDNLDTGNITPYGKYERADKTYRKLLEKLDDRHFASVDPELRATILGYFRSGRPVDVKVAALLAKMEGAKPLNPLPSDLSTVP